MPHEKQKTNFAALHHQKHFWGSLLVGLLLWILAAVLPIKYENLIFMAVTGGIFCGFYAFMVIATYDSSGRLRPKPHQMHRLDEGAAARLSIPEDRDNPLDVHAHSLDEISQKTPIVSP